MAAWVQQGERLGDRSQLDGGSDPEQDSDPLGIRDFFKKQGKSRDPLPRKVYICTHMHTRDNFWRFLDLPISMNSHECGAPSSMRDMGLLL
jgi:hypothetical protein